MTLWRTSNRSFGVGFIRVRESHPAAVRSKIHMMWVGAFAFIVIAIFSGAVFLEGRKGDAV